MTEDEYTALALRTCKSGVRIVLDISYDQAHILHMGVGLAGEAGELLDAIKKHTIYQIPLDRANIVEELGDIYWYIAGLKRDLDITDEEIRQTNIAKLRKRYPGEFSMEAARDRADKQEG